jgi:ABC transport system ATP-binding/permease protein
VVVSHDRYFLERVTDHVLALVAGRLAFLPGGVDEYLRLRASAGGVAALSAGPPSAALLTPAAPAARKPSAAAGAAARPASAEPGRPDAARQRAAQKELARLERQIARLSDTEAELSADLAANASDYTVLVELGARLRAVQEERAGLEDRWLEVADEISS